MKFTAAALLFPALAAAAPIAEIEARSEPNIFTLMSVRSASPIHYQQVNAAGQHFWIGKQTATYCPEGVSGLDCSKFTNSTTAVGTSQTGKATGAFMDTTVPGGQGMYVEKTGAVGFTQAHSGSVPTGASTTGFVYTAPSDGQSWGYLSYKGQGATGFVACPAGEHVYQIYANVKALKKTNCLGFDAFALPYNGTSAWQYT